MLPQKNRSLHPDGLLGGVKVPVPKSSRHKGFAERGQSTISWALLARRIQSKKIGRVGIEFALMGRDLAIMKTESKGQKLRWLIGTNFPKQLPVVPRKAVAEVSKIGNL